MNQNVSSTTMSPQQHARQFYQDALAVLDRSGVPYVVGGGYAMAFYTGISRHTKDLDLFVRPEDRDRALDVLAAHGHRTEQTWPPFLVKALCGDAFVDLLHNSGNGMCPVDDEWFAHAVQGPFLERTVMYCPPEEMIWSKAFVMERDRFDGADVNHLILARGRQFDWDRLMRRFAGHERVLLAHLLLFNYVYPSEERIPSGVTEHLLVAIHGEQPPAEPVCRGTLLAQKQYKTDISAWGYGDARLRPWGTFTPKDIEQLPAA